jgi:hypothetical protein
MAILFGMTLYLVHYRRSIAVFSRMQRPEGMFEMFDSRLKISSDYGTSDMPWSSIREIWPFPRFWLLFFSKAQFMIFPLAEVDSKLQGFLIERVGEAGGRIRTDK